MVAGDVVNTAARLQAAAPVNGILVGEETHAGTRTVIEYRPLEAVHAKGKAAPVRAWLAVTPRAAVGERALSPGPLIGRGPQLETLRGIWERVVEQRRPHLVTLDPSGGAEGWGRSLRESAGSPKRYSGAQQDRPAVRNGDTTSAFSFAAYTDSERGARRGEQRSGQIRFH